MIEVRQEDMDRARAIQKVIAQQLGNAGFVVYDCITPGKDNPLTQAFAAHRQQAEDAMRERCANVCDVYSQVNFETAGDSVLLDPVLRGKGFSPANVAASETHQIDGLVHSSYAHAGQHLATVIRGIDAGGEG